MASSGREFLHCLYRAHTHHPRLRYQRWAGVAMGPAGVTLLDAADAALVSCVLVAVTEKV